jgi:hypothetical protein
MRRDIADHYHARMQRVLTFIEEHLSSSNPPPEIRNDERRSITAALPGPTIPVAASRVRSEYIRDPPTVLLRAAGFP